MIIAIIPARGGSKRIPHKNIKYINGKPLIAWTLESAYNSTYLDDIVVSTDDPAIAHVAERYGARHISNRPKELAMDNTPTLSVLQHHLSEIEGCSDESAIDAIVLLQPTSPIRNRGLIDHCIQTFINTGADSVATGSLISKYEWGTPEHIYIPYFYDNGSVYVLKPENVIKGDLWGLKRTPIYTSEEQNIEIDTPFDFWIVEQIMKNQTEVSKLTQVGYK